MRYFLISAQFIKMMSGQSTGVADTVMKSYYQNKQLHSAKIKFSNSSGYVLHYYNDSGKRVCTESYSGKRITWRKVIVADTTGETTTFYRNGRPKRTSYYVGHKAVSIEYNKRGRAKVVSPNVAYNVGMPIE